jgi:hypothetical protein
MEIKGKAYFSKNELAEFLNKSTRTIEVWASMGILPYIKIRRSILFPVDGVKQSLARYERKGGEL